MFDFFQIVSVETLGGSDQILAVRHAGYFFVLIEVILALFVLVVACVAVAVLPSISALGGVSVFLKKRQSTSVAIRQRPAVAANEVPKSEPSTPAAPKPEVVSPTVVPIPVERTAPIEPAVHKPSPPLVVTPTTAAPAQKTTPSAPMVDLDAVFDEFCDEETLMDEAFVNSIIAPAAESDKPQAPTTVKAATVAAQKAATPASTSTREDSELAKKMMRGFAANNDSKKKVVAAAPAEERPTKKYEDVVAPQAPAVAKKPMPQAAVDLDAVFDELETTEEALNDALLDSIVKVA
ncbi:membrane-associated protein, putative [Bodo saltans]|uniref:Membrane-associated protein, putative n=1 Tax=Bodo saltans TaxID=75058 RepID=A0A0S4J5L1_BODSA|nr:membrane-associated protein, putative [Bodo saltans]|eukprot:CUG83852.1 membrane-associated protein, putative [Bodo saltans]